MNTKPNREKAEGEKTNFIPNHLRGKTWLTLVTFDSGVTMTYHKADLRNIVKYLLGMKL